MFRAPGVNHAVHSPSWLLRAGDGSRSDRLGYFRRLAAVMRCTFSIFDFQSETASHRRTFRIHLPKKSPTQELALASARMTMTDEMVIGSALALFGSKRQNWVCHSPLGKL